MAIIKGGSIDKLSNNEVDNFGRKLHHDCWWAEKYIISYLRRFMRDDIYQHVLIVVSFVIAWSTFTSSIDERQQEGKEKVNLFAF